MIGANSFISPDFVVADDVMIGRNCTITGSGRIGQGCIIENNVVIDGKLTLGARNRIGNNAVLLNDIVAGDDNIFHSSCVIGDFGQHPDLPESSGSVRIGNRNTFREFVSIHLPTVDAFTSIGDDCYFMAYCHIAHDCRVGNHIKMANAATLAGHVIVGDFSYLGLHSVIHQRVEIGEYTMIDMNSSVMRHVPHFAVMVDGRFAKINRIGLERKGFSAQAIAEIESCYGFAGEDVAFQPGILTEKIQAYAEAHKDSRVYQPFKRAHEAG